MIQPQLARPYCGSRNLETARWYKAGTWFVRRKERRQAGPSIAKTEAEAVRLFDTRSEPRQERLGI